MDARQQPATIIVEYSRQLRTRICLYQASAILLVLQAHGARRVHGNTMNTTAKFVPYDRSINRSNTERKRQQQPAQQRLFVAAQDLLRLASAMDRSIDAYCCTKVMDAARQQPATIIVEYSRQLCACLRARICLYRTSSALLSRMPLWHQPHGARSVWCVRTCIQQDRFMRRGKQSKQASILQSQQQQSQQRTSDEQG